MNKKYAGLDFPAWFDGKDVNEAAFCREFLSLDGVRSCTRYEEIEVDHCNGIVI